MPQPTVSYAGHPHLLTVVLEDMPTHTSPCNECGRPCDSPPVFHCARCDFNLHLLCGPLPKMVKPEHHFHTLSLFDSFVEDDSGEYYCDMCEMKRDPRDCVYSCVECDFIGHLKCAMPEVLSSLKGETGDVELRTLGKFIPGWVVSNGSNSKTADERGKQIPESSLTLKDIYNSLTEDEIMEFKNLSISSADFSADNETTSPFSSSYSDDTLIQLLKRLDAVTVPWEELIKFYNWDAKVVYVGQLQVTWDFAYIVEKLMSKHEELIAESSLSPKLKSLVFVLLCDMVHGMYTTNIEDVTEQMLMNWWRRLKVVRRANFHVQLVMDQLTRVVSAYFALEVKRFDKYLNEQIKRVSKELDVLRERREQHEKYVKSPISTIITKCLEEASALSWKTVGSDLL